jgi:ABC-type transporter Mla MlaB component
VALRPGTPLEVHVGVLKILATRQTGAELTVALIGTVQREYLPDLEGVVRQAAQDRRRLSLDLSQVRLVDRDTVAFLASLVERQVRLIGCPAYLRQWLRSEARSTPAGRPRHGDNV